jgi:hypothetical protein
MYSGKPAKVTPKQKGQKPAGKKFIPAREESPEELSYKPMRGFKLDGIYGGQRKQKWDRFILLLPHDEFSARGMRCLYMLSGLVEIPNSRFAQETMGRAKIHCRCTLSFGIWREKTGRILVRFKSTRYHHDCLCYEIVGWTPPAVFPGEKFLDDSQLPWIVKAAYEDWETDCFDYPDD